MFFGILSGSKLEGVSHCHKKEDAEIMWQVDITVQKQLTAHINDLKKLKIKTVLD